MAFPVNAPAPAPTAYPSSYSAVPTLPFPSPSGPPPVPMATDPNAPTKSLADVEMEYILQVYAKNGMNKQKTSDELGISLKTLYNKLHKYEEEAASRRRVRRPNAQFSGSPELGAAVVIGEAPVFTPQATTG